MARPKPVTRLSEFDLMIIRAGGHTLAELESMDMSGTKFRCKPCAFLADSLYRIVVRIAMLNHNVHRDRS